MQQLQTGADLVDILAPYEQADRSRRRGPCWLMANMVGGLDGSAAVAGRAGGLASAADAELFHAIRSLSDVILVGAETVRREGYGAAKLNGERRRSRVEAGKSPVPRIAIVSRSLDLDWEGRVFAEAAAESATVLLTCDAADPGRLAEARRVAEVVVAGGASVEPTAALTALADRGAEVVLCEGGPSLLGQLVTADLLDELCLTLEPVMGGDPLPIAVSAGDSGLRRFSLAHAVVNDSTLFLRHVRRAER